MNWLGKILGYRDREYRGNDFSVRIEPIMREVVSVSHTRNGAKLHMDGERIGKKWEGIGVNIPPEVESARVSQIVSDLQTAFEEMRYEYMIARLAEVEVVPEAERESAIAELRAMGYELEVSPDRKQIRQTRIPGTPRVGMEEVRKTMPRYRWLLQAVRGTRPRFEILAKSKEF